MPKGLGAYRDKRDFTRTAEPSGDANVRPAPYRRFVVQKHDATRLHYDLRLEVDGVFRSWAVTRGPSLDPADKRLAVEVEDHPLDYGDFEGTIPKGEYGGGSVMVWDRGFWAPLGDEDPARALAAGELKFTVAGEKLKGEFVLVRMKHDRARKGGSAGRSNWLLIKHKDEWARPGDGEAVLAADRSVASGRTMAQIAAGRGKAPRGFMLDDDCPAPPGDIWNAERTAASRVKEAEAKATRRRSARSSGAARIAAVTAQDGRVAGVKISNPDKELWPAGADTAPVTKRQLAEYLATVAPWMVPHIEGRPCSVLRAPDGIGGQTFFQRHAMPGLPDAVRLVKVRDEREPYVQIDDLEGLVGMGQLAALEFHPWNSAPDLIEVPGRLVFDLDPAPDVAFDVVVAAARELRDRLDKLGLAAFAKTTGGKGMHVVVPLTPRARDGIGWDHAKLFTQTLASQMAEDSPERYLVNMAKAKRKGRIFIDYLRNDRTATAVAPLSPRARAGATVSMPLTWTQVKAGLDPRRFTIHAVPGLLAKSTAWREYDAAAAPLKPAIEKLVGAVR